MYYVAIFIIILPYNYCILFQTVDYTFDVCFVDVMILKRTSKNGFIVLWDYVRKFLALT